ncbi:unnamed protein product [Peronospora farinosa]|uniref:Uncharacterized protein n=1 Tax=Peronospora farinosa TaxID=134698 RepID=A0AAV0T9G4_9STRA|nr:unnamed protein product [Peronospora farinosa]CAI5715205.1 unnamed protein product [Peronospora farinosa]
MSGGQTSALPLRPPRPSDPPVAAPRTEKRDIEAVKINGSIQPTTAGAEEHELDVWSTEAVTRLRQEITAESRALKEQKREITGMYQIATCKYSLHAYFAIRAMPEDEKAVMEAYLGRRLELPTPPKFLSCTATANKKAALLSLLQTHIEATLIVDVPAHFRLGKGIPRQSVLREMAASNTTTAEDKAKMKRFL